MHQKNTQSRWWKVAAATTALVLMVGGGTVLNYRWAHNLSTPLSLTEGLDALLYACVIVGVASIVGLIVFDVVSTKHRNAE